ncbi:hypothetical protein ACQKJ1_04530 [Methylorubrum rhodesianum]|uniref:hypothetical protein n=1 Tax=Methylorubrum rhodesianum TaxID=29427 RepID=UPI003CFE643F
MSRQHSAPILISPDNKTGVPLTALGQQAGAEAVSEADIQALVHAHPSCLPISEIDSIFAKPVAICRELQTPAGSIDNLLITPTGLPILVECKLWRNPQGRREVVGQILDYAKELSRWSSSDLQREVARCLKWKLQDDPVLSLVRDAGHEVDEIEFNDNLTVNLRRGRFLLLIVGDGIREGVEAIAEYLQAHAGLHFSLGLVELPIFKMPNGGRLVTPRVLVRTTNIIRSIVAVPEGFALEGQGDVDAPAGKAELDPERAALGDARLEFWKAFLDQLKLDDPEQFRPNPARQGYISVSMPAPNGSSWLTVYRDMLKNEVGVFLSSTRGTLGERASQAIVEEWDVVCKELGGSARLSTDPYGRSRIGDSASFGPLDDSVIRQQAFIWLAERVNRFINILRPRVRSFVADEMASRA